MPDRRENPTLVMAMAILPEQVRGAVAPDGSIEVLTYGMSRRARAYGIATVGREVASMSCHRCGECCRKFYLPHPPETIMTEEWLRDFEPELDIIRGMLIFVQAHPAHGQWEYTCKHFRESLPDGKPGCAIRDTRPKMCSEYPQRSMSTLKPGCGYEVKP